MSNIEASAVTVVPPTAPPVLNMWFLENFTIRGYPDRTQPIMLSALFVKGAEIKDESGNVTGYFTDPNFRTHYEVRDVFNPTTLEKHPEIAALMPQFLVALDAVGKRLGVL
jgi:hypothetical protein